MKSPDLANKPFRLALQDSLYFVVPCLLFLEIRILGRLFVPEILLLALTPLCLRSRRQWRPTIAMVVLMLAGFAWLLSQAATDVIRETPFQDWTRGTSKIIFLLLNFLGITLLLGERPRAWLLFASGLGTGLVILMIRQGTTPFAEDGWKFGGGLGTCMLVIALASLPRRFGAFLLPVLSLVGLAALSIWIGGRSLAGAALATVCYLVFCRLNSRASQGSRVAPVLAVVFLFASGLGILKVYEVAAGSGMLGEAMRLKFERQLARGEGSVLRGGRTESEVSLIAISDSPIIGHGSWAKSSKYAAMADANAMRAGEQAVRKTEVNSIPTHSHLLGSWVEAGFFGAVFWTVLGGYCLSAIVRRHAHKDPLLPIATFLTILLLWDLAFSPFGAFERMTAAFVMALVTRERRA